MQPLSDVTVCEGEIAQMEVKFSHGNVEGSWMRNGQPLQPSQRVHMVIDKQIHKLLIEDTNKDDSGVYSFEVPAQEISTSAKLLIQSEALTCTWCFYNRLSLNKNESFQFFLLLQQSES